MRRRNETKRRGVATAGGVVFAAASILSGCPPRSLPPIPTAPVPRTPVYEVVCRRLCSGSYSYVERVEPPSDPTRLGGVACMSRGSFAIEPQLLQMTILTEAADAATQLAECVAAFDRLTDERIGGRQITGIEQAWLNDVSAAGDLVRARCSGGVAPGLEREGAISITCEPPADNALDSVREVSTGSPARPVTGGIRCGEGRTECPDGHCYATQT